MAATKRSADAVYILLNNKNVVIFDITSKGMDDTCCIQLNDT